jgi:cyanophycin synthetase
VDNAIKGSLIVLCSDVVPDALDLVKELKEKEANQLYEFTTDQIPNIS